MESKIIINNGEGIDNAKKYITNQQTMFMEENIEDTRRILIAVATEERTSLTWSEMLNIIWKYKNASILKAACSELLVNFDNRVVPM